jgi:hypothetical protein
MHGRHFIHPAWAAGFSLSTLAQLNIQADAPQWIMVGFGVVTALIVSLQLFALVVSVLLLPAVTAHKCALCSEGRMPPSSLRVCTPLPYRL